MSQPPLDKSDFLLFAAKLPDKLETNLGEKGILVSGGERQRIALARMFFDNSKIIILDEATSSIDAKTEHLLQEGISNLLKNRTSVIIAHRLSTIKNCDKILFIKDGRIEESGSHEELMKKKRNQLRFLIYLILQYDLRCL